MAAPEPSSCIPYPGQFVVAPDLLHVAIPRMEIMAEMTLRGEHEALNDVCLSVAVVADAIGAAQLANEADWG